VNNSTPPIETAKRKLPMIIHEIIIVSIVPSARHEIVFTTLLYPFSSDLRLVTVLSILLCPRYFTTPFIQKQKPSCVQQKGLYHSSNLIYLSDLLLQLKILQHIHIIVHVIETIFMSEEIFTIVKK
jgi:hypothetical protein